VLVPIESVAEISNTPVSKSVPVSIVKVGQRVPDQTSISTTTERGPTR
jgi:hypothetical protein